MQHAIYFDTADHQLAARGLSLRIRRVGEEHIQTTKASNGRSAGLFSRQEWEIPVKNDKPVLDGNTPVTHILGGEVANIAPLFKVDVERRIWSIHQNDAAMEVVLDRGAAIVGERLAPICEIELELKSGTASALFAYAHKLDAIAPVRLGVLSKSERGYRLLRAAPGAIKAETVVLGGGMTTAQAFVHIAHSCLRQYRLNEDLLLSGRDAEALHQARVALRRLRSAISLFKKMLADDRLDHFRDELRWLACILGEARNLDVLLAQVDPGEVQSRIESARDCAYADVETALASPRVRSLLLGMAEWLEDGNWRTMPATLALSETPSDRFASDALARLRKQIKKQGRTLADSNDETRHEVRKIAKKLRYASEFFATLYPHPRQQRRQGRFVAALEDLQDQLGAINDRVTAHAILSELGIAEYEYSIENNIKNNKSKILNLAENANNYLVDLKKFW